MSASAIDSDTEAGFIVLLECQALFLLHFGLSCCSQAKILGSYTKNLVSWKRLPSPTER